MLELLGVALLLASWGIFKTWRFTSRKTNEVLLWLRTNAEPLDNLVERRLHITSHSVASLVVAIGIGLCTMPWLFHGRWWLEAITLIFWILCFYQGIRDFANWVSPSRTPPAR